jgi:hypothetical protein
MTKMVQEAIEALKELPEDRQVTVARAILDYASHDDDHHHHLTDDERREVRAGLANMRRGDIASDEEMAETYKRIGL